MGTRLPSAGALLLLMTACASGPPPPPSTPRSTASASTSQAIVPTPSLTLTPTPSPSFLAAVGPQCSAADLLVGVTPASGAGGSGEVILLFTDRGSHPCTLRGTPIVRFVDAKGRIVASPSVRASLGGMFPTYPNNGVGLVPLPPTTASGGYGVRGQAALPLQYSDLMCATSVASVRVILSSGTLSAPLQLPGAPFRPCLAPTVSVNPFQPAEYRG
jgi:hypothetical protein